MSPNTPTRERRMSVAATMTPTQLTSDILKLDISPAKGDRSNPGHDSRTANKRPVQEPNVHSAEEVIFILKLESFIVQCVEDYADHPKQILEDANGNHQDIVRTLHSLKKLYNTMRVGSPATYLRSGYVLGSVEIEALIDTLRVHINTSKHDREIGIVVFGTDLRAVAQSARVVRSCLFLSQGPSSIARVPAFTSIPRFGKLERLWVMRLLLARQNSFMALDKNLLEDLRRQVPMEQFTRYPRVVKTLSLDLLPHFRWIDVYDIMLSCRDAIDDVFDGWIRRYRSDPGFNQIYPVLEQRSLPQLVGLVRRHLLTGVNITTSRQNAQIYFAMRDGDEPTYILDTALLEHKLADHYARIQDPAVKGTAHELYSVLVGTIDVMIGLKGTGHRFYLEAMKLFDAFLVLFTEDIDIRTPGLIPLDLNILENWEELGPGVSFYNIDIFEVQNGGTNYYNFIAHSAISEEASPLDEFFQSTSASHGIAASLAAAASHGTTASLGIATSGTTAATGIATTSTHLITGEQITSGDSLHGPGHQLAAPDTRFALLRSTANDIWERMGDYIAIERKGDDWRTGNLKVIVRLLQFWNNSDQV